jgi:hypothetical protein
MGIITALGLLRKENALPSKWPFPGEKATPRVDASTERENRSLNEQARDPFASALTTTH